MNNSITYSLGICAQILFSSRFLVQLIYTEKEKKVANPVVFWFLSLGGAFFMLIYGILRFDLVIITGQFVNYLIYLRNISLKNKWPSRFIKYGAYLFPWLMLVGITPTNYNLMSIFQIQIKTMSVFLIGIIGQSIFNTRFIYQWLFSEIKKTSHLPFGFWVMSLTGGSVLLIYAVLRKDPILFLGQLFGLITYSRNMYYDRKSKA